MTPLVTFHTLWSRFAPVANRNDRLRWIGKHLHRAVDSSKDVSEEEMGALIAALRREMAASSSRVVNMRGAPVAPASNEQQWKIRQLEVYLGWQRVPERLAGLLRDKYHVDRVDQLSAGGAWRVIETLFGIAAAPHKGATKRAEIKRLKELLRTWRPNAA